MPAFPPIELGTPGKPACPDSYEARSERACAGASKLTIQISKAAVYIQFGEGIGGIQWGNEEPYMPVSGQIIRSFDAVRVRNLVAGQAAQVLLTAIA